MSISKTHYAKTVKHGRKPRGQSQNNIEEVFETEKKIKNVLKIHEIEPLTDNQRKVFDDYDDGKNLFLHGFPGTGKSFLSIYLALDEILEGGSVYDKLIIVRSTVPSRDQGFMPGKAEEKESYYESPYVEICHELFGRSDAYPLLKTRGVIQFTSTSFLRSVTFRNAIVVFDEMQNATAQELGTLITRIGENCKVIFCGDLRQSDLLNTREKTGLPSFMKIIKQMSLFNFIEFEVQDIVRSNLVKQFIIAKCDLEDKGVIQLFM